MDNTYAVKHPKLASLYGLTRVLRLGDSSNIHLYWTFRLGIFGLIVSFLLIFTLPIEASRIDKTFLESESGRLVDIKCITSVGFNNGSNNVVNLVYDVGYTIKQSGFVSLPEIGTCDDALVTKSMGKPIDLQLYKDAVVALQIEKKSVLAVNEGLKRYNSQFGDTSLSRHLLAFVVIGLFIFLTFCIEYGRNKKFY